MITLNRVKQIVITNIIESTPKVAIRFAFFFTFFLLATLSLPILAILYQIIIIFSSKNAKARVNTLTNKLTEKEEEIDNLTSDNNYLKSELNKWKNRFLNIINFIKNRLLRPKDKDRYDDFTIDLYTIKQ